MQELMKGLLHNWALPRAPSTWVETSHWNHRSAGEGYRHASITRGSDMLLNIWWIHKKRDAFWYYRRQTRSAAILDRVAWVDVRCRWLLPFTYKKEKVGEPRLPRPAHLRQTGGQTEQEMFESTGNGTKTLSMARPHTIISNVTHCPPPPLKHL